MNSPAVTTLRVVNKIWQRTQSTGHLLFHGIFDLKLLTYIFTFLKRDPEVCLYNIECNCEAEGARPHRHVLWSTASDNRRALKKYLGRLTDEQRAPHTSTSGSRKRRATYNKLITQRQHLAGTILYIQTRYTKGKRTGELSCSKHNDHKHATLPVFLDVAENKACQMEMRAMDPELDSEWEAAWTAAKARMSKCRADKENRKRNHEGRLLEMEPSTSAVTNVFET